MKIVELAILAIDACDSENVEHMLTGALATGIYAVPRSTSDVDLVLNIESQAQIVAVIDRLSSEVSFDQQTQFDTLTWGKRHVGRTTVAPYFTLELFELFDDGFVRQQFARRVGTEIGPSRKRAYVPTAEDLIVQKLRWARDKDLIDARDVMVVQRLQNLDMDYVRNWCRQHRSEERLDRILADLPEI